MSLAQVRFNGSLCVNGSTLPQLITGYNYSFSAVLIASGYVFEQWAVSSGGISGSISSTTGKVYFGCILVSGQTCATVNLSLALESSNHSLMSGQAYHASFVHSMSASFTVPALNWYSNPSQHSPPPNGKYEIVDWGVGLGGLLDSSTVVVGLQVYFNSTQTQGIFTSTYFPFWSTSFEGTASEVHFAPSKTVAQGDTINVSIGEVVAFNCGLIPHVSVSDINQKWSFGTNYNTCPSPPVYHSGEWMAWDPLNGSGILSPSYTGEKFTNLTFNTNAVYPVWRGLFYPCGPALYWPLCLPSVTPHVNFVQWAIAGKGWNESLNPGNITYLTGGNAALEPLISTLANVQVFVFRYNPISNQTYNDFFVLLNGVSYADYHSGNLPWNANSSLGLTGAYTFLNQSQTFSAGFDKWGTTNGTLGNASQQNTSLDVNGPGMLEALILGVYPTWSGYMEAVNQPGNATNVSLIAGRFIAPTLTYNHTFSGSEILNVVVGLGGFAFNNTQGVKLTHHNDTGFASAGLNATIRSNGVVSYTPTFTFVSQSGGRSFTPSWSFNASHGDTILASVAVVGAPGCTGAKVVACWSVADLNRLRNSSQNNSDSFENWSGVLQLSSPCSSSGGAGGGGIFGELERPSVARPSANCSYSFRPYTAEWLALPIFNATYVSAPLPVFSAINYSVLELNWKEIFMLGPFEAMNGVYHLAAGKGTQTISPQTVVGARAKSFTDQQT